MNILSYPPLLRVDPATLEGGQSLKKGGWVNRKMLGEFGKISNTNRYDNFGGEFIFIKLKFFWK